MWFFKKNKYDKIKREDIVENIINIEKQQNQEIANIEERNKEVDALMIKGRSSNDKNYQLVLAKKINLLRQENQRSTQRIQFLNGNLKVLNQLKMALDDRGFLDNNSNMSLNQLLSDSKSLHKFLDDVNSKRSRRERDLGDVMDTFDAYEEDLDADDRIYGITEADDQLLSIFETGKSSSDENFFEEKNGSSTTKNILDSESKGE